jgi:predicted XRE-type DNA-binding protein
MSENWRDDPLEFTAPVRSKSFLHDMGYENPDEIRVKFLLVGRIRSIIQERKLRQSDIVRLAASYDDASLKQPDISRILNGNVKGYSDWRLMRLLNALGEDVRLITMPAKTDRATIDVIDHQELMVVG